MHIVFRYHILSIRCRRWSRLLFPSQIKPQVMMVFSHFNGFLNLLWSYPKVDSCSIIIMTESMWRRRMASTMQSWKFVVSVIVQTLFNRMLLHQYCTYCLKHLFRFLFQAFFILSSFSIAVEMVLREHYIHVKGVTWWEFLALAWQ